MGLEPIQNNLLPPQDSASTISPHSLLYYASSYSTKRMYNGMCVCIKLFYTRLLFAGRQPLCGCSVVS